MDAKIKSRLLIAQKNEITEHFIYDKLAKASKDSHNKKILQKISTDELRHYHLWRSHTKEDLKPDRWKLWKYYLIAKVLGLTFGIKLMEKGEERAQQSYQDIAQTLPAAKAVQAEEDRHEKQLIALLDEERLRYAGSIVLGLNDALVELTGALAGLTLALQNTRLIAMAGLITGIAASFSMSASEYLSTKSEETSKSPVKASIYTGIAYILTVLFLIFPYLIFKSYYISLAFTLVNAIVVILFFTFYISVAKDLSFKKRFSEMALISLGVAVLSFCVGFIVRLFLHVDI